MFKDWIKAFEESFMIAGLVFMLAFVWMCVYSSWLYDVVSHEMYDLISYGVVYGLAINVTGHAIACVLSKIIERRERRKQANMMIDPFVIG